MKLSRLAIGTTAAGTAVLTAYATLVRPWLLHWGASEEERCQPLPGDEIVQQPNYHLTDAVAIDAPVQAVWPWLVHLGQGRGGPYSYDWLENLVGCDIHSLDRIDPQLQQLAPGDTVRLVPGDFRVPLRFQVAQVDPPCAPVLRGAGTRQDAIQAGLPFPSWAFVLRPQLDGSTHLLVRWRSDFRPGVANRLTNQYLLEPVHFVMERKMLLGIKQRAERSCHTERRRKAALVSA